jgi:hypothetical protein
VVAEPIDGVAELAAITPEQQVAEIRGALCAVFEAWSAWSADPGYPRRVLFRDPPPLADQADRLNKLIDNTRQASAALPHDADLAAMIAVVQPLLNAHFPSWPPPAATVLEMVDRLRYLAMSRTSLIASAKQVRRHPW